jgi:aspartyl-tRNA(Asn)/glutamyl-tRNA(Gln) amidotransferase subunit B
MARNEINLNTAKAVLVEMLASGKSAAQIISERGLQQVSDSDLIADLVQKTLQQHPQELASYLAGKETLANWFFGQVMRAARGQANPQVLRAELERQLQQLKEA